MPIIDLIGKNFGRIEVISFSHIGKNRYAYWNCKCDCGNEKVIDGKSLRNKHTISCTCFQNETLMKNINKLDLGEAALNSLYGKYKRDAKRRNHEFKLNIDEFHNLTTKKCNYCNCEPSQIWHPNRMFGGYIYNGIDRINSDLGYILENCVSCCGRCNEAKMSEKQEDFKLWIEKVYNHFVKGENN